MTRRAKHSGARMNGVVWGKKGRTPPSRERRVRFIFSRRGAASERTRFGVAWGRGPVRPNPLGYRRR